LNEETTEEDLQDLFGDFGEVKNLSMALNRRTGYVMVSPGFGEVGVGIRNEAGACWEESTGAGGWGLLEEEEPSWVLRGSTAWSLIGSWGDARDRGGRMPVGC
jgi:RNA recognition motif-containing protein